MLPRTALRSVGPVRSTSTTVVTSTTRSLHLSAEARKGFPVRRVLGATKKRSSSQRRAEVEGWKNELKVANENAKASGLKTDWSIKTAVIIERPEILAPEPPEWVVKFNEWKKKWDEPIAKQRPDIFAYFKSYEDGGSGPASSTGGEEKDKKKKGGDKKPAAPGAGKPGDKKPAAEAAPVDAEAEQRRKRAEQLRAEAQVEETITYGPRITEADQKNDRKSLRRKLDRKLFLIVKKDRAQNAWQFPVMEYKEGGQETSLRQVAEKSIFQRFGESFNRYFVGNAPIGVYTFPYEAEQQKKLNTYGAKVFYYYGYYIQGQVELQKSTDVVDYAWVTQDELKEYLDPATMEYLSRVLPMEGLF